MTQYYQIQASPSIIRHATVLFNATLRDILIELLQNSRRANATEVQINLKTRNDETYLVVEDNGAGIFQNGVHITLGDSGWEESIQNRECPAGMGVFSLAQRGCVIEANNQQIELKPEHFNGEQLVEIISTNYDKGTRFTFPLKENEIITIETLIPELARFYTLPLHWNGRQMPQENYLEGALYVEEWEGLQIGVFNDYHKAEINFYGLLIRHYGFPILENCIPNRYLGSITVKINVIDSPQLRLTLPSRKELVHDKFCEQLQDHCKTVLYRYLAKYGQHYLSFAHHQEALKRGIKLPPATAQLCDYAPRIGDIDNYHRNQERHKLQADKEYLLVDCEEEAAIEQIVARSLERAYPHHRLLVTREDMKGYQWYDELPRITAMKILVHFEHESHFLYEVPDTMRSQPVKTIDVVLEVTTQEQYCSVSVENSSVKVAEEKGETSRERDFQLSPQHPAPYSHAVSTENLSHPLPYSTQEKVETITLPSDIGFWCDEEVYYDLSAVYFFIPEGSGITVDELSHLLYETYFRFSDDSSADSYETQSNEFQDEAEYTAVHTLKTGEEATKQRLKMYMERNLLWMMPDNQRVIITVDNRNIDVSFG